MSRIYQNPKDVPLEKLCQRLDELSDAVTKGQQADHEFTMRIPAECDRDADIVLAEAARRLREIGTKNPPKSMPKECTNHEPNPFGYLAS
jgi:hypothetical protein